MREGQKARKIQKATGISYQTCLFLVRGEISWVPQSPNCVIVKMLTELKCMALTLEPKPDGKPCLCEECDP